MGRPSINDDMAIIEVAIVLHRNSGISFAKAFRRAKYKIANEITGNSLEAIRRRLQRKYNKHRSYWAEQAEGEISLRRTERNAQIKENMASVLGRFAELSERMNRVARLFKPHPALKALQGNSFRITSGIEKALNPLNRVAKLMKKNQEQAARNMRALELPRIKVYF